MAETLAWLGACRLLGMNKSDATGLKNLQRALAIFETSKAKDDPELARMLTAVGTAYMLHGELDAAESAFTNSLAISEKAFGSESPSVASILEQLGHVHFERAAKAREAWLDSKLAPIPNQLGHVHVGLAAKAREAWLDDDPDPDALRVRQADLASIEQHAGKLAESFYNQAVKIRAKSLKPDDPAIAETLYNLGCLVVWLERTNDCVPYFEHFLEAGAEAKRPRGRSSRERFDLAFQGSVRTEGFRQSRTTHGAIPGRVPKGKGLRERRSRVYAVDTV